MPKEPEQNFVFFWGHSEKSGDKACLSNWYPSKFKDEKGVEFFNSEQYMMWRKAKLFGDEETANLIMGIADPQEVKKLGRQVKNFDQDLWNKNARQIVFDGCLLKFLQNNKAKEYLLSTGDKTIVEASPHDTIWGIGLSASDPKACDREQWKGTNWLGLELMRVRETIREKEGKSGEGNKE